MNCKTLIITFSFIILFGFCTKAQTIDRGPYLQSVTTESIVVKWRTDAPTDGKIWYGLTPSNLNFSLSAGINTTEHELLIDGLNSNMIYYYAVGNSNGQMVGGDGNHYFITSPGPSTNQNIKLWVLGDCGTANDNQRAVRDAYYNYISEGHTDAIILLGDNAYSDGTQSEYQMSLFENMYEDKLVKNVLWSTFGNHDGNSSQSVTQTGPYYDIFTFPKNGEAGGVASGTEAYYSFDYGNIHFISLNSDDIDADPNGDMVQWLENDIDATNQEWIIAFFHHPPYTGEGGNESDFKQSSTEMREIVAPILEAGGADLVLTGHTHAYQRSYLIRGHYDDSPTWDPDSMGIDLGDGRIDGDGAYFKEIGSEGIGTVYMVAGSSGKLYNDDYNHPVMSQNFEKLGSVAINIEGLQMDVKFIDSDGIIQDYFTIVKMVDPPFVNITYPLDQEYFPSPETITITADAWDDNGSITQVEFFVDNVSIGIDHVAPYSVNWTIPSEGGFKIKAVATDNNGYFRSSTVNINVGHLNICSRVNSSSDDAEEKSSGDVSLTSSDLELVNDGLDQTVGIRFNNLNIPQCAEISSAFIQFTAEESGNINPCNLIIFAEASDNAGTFINDDWNISARPKTNSIVVWSPPDWSSVGASGSDQRTIDIAPLIQEVVDRPGFTNSSSIAIFIEGVGRRSAESFDGQPYLAPELCIEFIPVGPDDDNDGICNALDQCPGSPEPGMPCDDGNPDTSNDIVDLNCDCVGEYDCPNLQANIGDPCDDGNALTYDDAVNSNCECNGVLYDCPSFPANIGDLCDDGNPDTSNDTVNSNCDCVGEYDCPNLQANIGDPCDDGNPDTSNDVVNSNCECVGEYDCPTLMLNIGDPCDDANNLTYDDIIDSNCECNGTLYDCISYPANIGDPCDDGDDNTTNDTINADCDCEGENIFDCPTIQANFGDPCDDGNAETYDDIIDPNCDCTGTPFDCPTLLANYGDSCDDGDDNTVNDAIDSSCNCVGSSVLVVNVSESSNDAEESQSGVINLTSSDLEMVIDGNLNQLIGLRFTNLNINQGSIIDSAFIQFTTDEINNFDPCLLNFYGEASDNALIFKDENSNISNRPKTNAIVTWTPAEWPIIGVSEPEQKTVNISSVLQEIVDRSGFNSNSAIVILIEGEGKRTAFSYDGNPEKAPELIVYFKNALVGIPEISQSNKSPILVYPVPAKDQLNVSLDCKMFQEAYFQIMDLNGRILFSKEESVDQGNNVVLLDNLTLQSGMYFIQVLFDGSVQTAKFTILK